MRYDVFLALALSSPGSPDPVPAPQTLRFPPTPAIGAPATPLKENVTTFALGSAALDWSPDGWRLTANGAALKDFGRRERDAEDALRLIRDLRLNGRGVVGGPSPTLEYWLSDGRPPQAPPPGLRVQPMDGPSLRVEKAQNQWVVRDDRRVLFNFGGAEADARQALDVIRKYGFTHVGVVNPAAPAMMIFFAEPDAAPPSVASRPDEPRRAESPSPEEPKVDPSSPAGRLLAKHPEILGGPVVAPAVPPLRQAAVSGNVLSSMSPTPDRTPFDYRQVRLRQDRGDWKLTAGGFTAADFGGDEYAARLGLSAMNYYRFTEQCSVGAGPERFTYLLAGGQAPRSTMFGVDGQSFSPARLEVRQVEGRWAVCAGDDPVVKMGERKEDAERVLDVIRKLQCDRVCRIGAADGKGMTFLVRTR